MRAFRQRKSLAVDEMASDSALVVCASPDVPVGSASNLKAVKVDCGVAAPPPNPTVPSDIVSCMRYFYDLTVNDDSVFGEYCKVFLTMEPGKDRSGRCRDIFPLPLLSSLSGQVDETADESTLLAFANLTVMALNFMWDDFGNVPSSSTSRFCNAPQTMVHRNVSLGVRRMVRRLKGMTAHARPAIASVEHPDLIASNVDMCPAACTCPSMNYVSRELSDAITSNGGLFRDVGKHRSAVPRFTSGKQSEYAAVTVRGLLTGKLRLRKDVSGGGTVFTVPKATGGLREVWHGRYISSLAPPPPKPRHQPTPACMLDLEVSADRPMLMSKRDAVSYFDSLAAPDRARNWFARPSAKAGESLNIFDITRTHVLINYVDGDFDSDRDQNVRLFPVACCWPMGFSWSSAVAQDVMLHQTSSAGLGDDMLLADDKPSPNFSLVDECFSVCTDDVIHWARSEAIAKRRLGVLDNVWKEAGIMRKPEKDLDWGLHGVALGCDYDGADGWLDASASKQLQSISDAAFLLTERQASPNNVMRLMGSLQWFDLLNRSKLAGYESIYGFEQLPHPDQLRLLPSLVRSELQASIALSVFWSADLSRRYLPFISASDASGEYGFGVCAAAASSKQVRQVAAYAEKRRDYVVLDDTVSKGVDKGVKKRQGVSRHLDLNQNDFKTILSIRARQPAHANVLECEAFLLWLRWLTRTSRHHNARAVCLVDSKVLLGCATKGRSSSKALLRVMRRAGAIQLAANILVRLVYTPTEYNPSDLASRGIRSRPLDRSNRSKNHSDKQESKRSRYHERLRNLITSSPYRDELASLVADDPLYWRFSKL